MPTVVTTLSIRPGQTRGLTRAVQQALQQAPAAAGFVSIWATEIGEVNTLTCMHEDADLEALLLRLDAWLAALSASEVGASLRHVQLQAFRVDPTGLPLKTLQAPAKALLQEHHDGPVAIDPARQVLLHALDGRHGRRCLLTPVGSYDEAVQRARIAVESAVPSLRASALLIPLA